MRWTCLLLLAGCSTWVTYDEGPEQRPHVVEALRAFPAAPVLFVDGDRGYWARPGVLDTEGKALASAPADALEVATASGPAGGGATDRDVIAFAHPTRSMETAAIDVEAYRFPDGLWYKVTVEAEDNRNRAAVCRSTPGIERAWRALLRAARTQAGGKLVGSMGPHGPLRDIGIDFRGLEEE